MCQNNSRLLKLFSKLSLTKVHCKRQIEPAVQLALELAQERIYFTAEEILVD